MRSSSLILPKLICTSSSASIHSSACLTRKTDIPGDTGVNSEGERKCSSICLRGAVSSSQAARERDCTASGCWSNASRLCLPIAYCIWIFLPTLASFRQPRCANDAAQYGRSQDSCRQRSRSTYRSTDSTQHSIDFSLCSNCLAELRREPC